MLITGSRHLRAVRDEYVAHYNRRRECTGSGSLRVLFGVRVVFCFTIVALEEGGDRRVVSVRELAEQVPRCSLLGGTFFYA